MLLLSPRNNSERRLWLKPMVFYQISVFHSISQPPLESNWSFLADGIRADVMCPLPASRSPFCSLFTYTTASKRLQVVPSERSPDVQRESCSGEPSISTHPQNKKWGFTSSRNTDAWQCQCCGRTWGPWGPWNGRSWWLLWRTDSGIRATGLGLWQGPGHRAQSWGQGVDRHHQPGPPGQGHEGQVPEGDLSISSPCPSRNLRSLTFSWGHFSRMRFWRLFPCKSRHVLGRGPGSRHLLPLGTTMDMLIWELIAQRK